MINTINNKVFRNANEAYEYIHNIDVHRSSNAAVMFSNLLLNINHVVADDT